MIRMQMFGRLRVYFGDMVATDQFVPKVQELLCYLLLFRKREHSRDFLAGHLWEDKSTAQAKRNLRQLVYQLQSVFEQHQQYCDAALVVVEPEWLQANTKASLWLDAWEFEDIYTQTRAAVVEQLNTDQLHALRRAGQLYKGDLLEGWYQDWCIFERERFQRMHLAMLEKLMTYHEAMESYEAGVEYGAQILRFDRAHERTHRRLMRMYSLAGDRTAALRQYEVCRSALEEELSVAPADSTRTLYEQICADQVGKTKTPPHSAAAMRRHQPEHHVANPPVFDGLKRVYETLLNLQHQLDFCVRMIENDMNRHS